MIVWAFEACQSLTEKPGLAKTLLCKVRLRIAKTKFPSYNKCLKDDLSKAAHEFLRNPDTIRP